MFQRSQAHFTSTCAHLWLCAAEICRYDQPGESSLANVHRSRCAQLLLVVIRIICCSRAYTLGPAGPIRLTAGVHPPIVATSVGQLSASSCMVHIAHLALHSSSRHTQPAGRAERPVVRHALCMVRHKAHTTMWAAHKLVTTSSCSTAPTQINAARAAQPAESIG